MSSTSSLLLVGLLLVVPCATSMGQVYNPSLPDQNQPTRQPRTNIYINTVDKAYSVLKDDNETPYHWSEGGTLIASVASEPGQKLTPSLVNLETGLPSSGYICAGEALRTTANPSISDLLKKRMNECLDLAHPDGTPTIDPGEVIDTGFKLAQALAFWDGKNHVQDLEDFVHRADNIELPPNDRDGKLFITRHTLDMLGKLVDLRDSSAANQLVNLLSTVTTIQISTPSGNRLSADVFVLSSLWERPNNPILAPLVDQFFTDSAHGWSPLIDPQRDYQLIGTLWTPLLGLPSFRKVVIEGLHNTDFAAETHTSELKTFFVPYGIQWNSSLSPDGMSDPTLDLRYCDLYALAIAARSEAPDFDPTWSSTQKDQAIVKIVAFLNQYGNAFQYSDSESSIVEGTRQPPFQPIMGVTGSFHLDQLDHPATPADVAAGKAIFTLNAPGRSTVLQLRTVPFNFRVDGNSQDFRNIWQAESVVDDHGVIHKFYGYTGNHQMGQMDESSLSSSAQAELESATVASSQSPPTPAHAPGVVGQSINLPPSTLPVQEGSNWAITPSIDGEVAPLNTSYYSGTAVTVKFELRNKATVAAPLPLGFCPTPTQRTLPIALSMGFGVALSTMEDESPQNNGIVNNGNHEAPLVQWTPLYMKPQPASVFTPGPPPATPSMIPPNGEYLLGSLDLSTLYDLSKPGQYRLIIGNPGQTNGTLTITFEILSSRF